ncbi:hypothetical protein BT63DRAFT_455376 [Microthyrium microscopicum]|uniref:Uncharacterized protein n=1 Tax=Microthyrium microscopicum TaxID=703497 RepID=A0A6A6UB39_9PEZI|nr:hypothetical protein BT63DRAFT_455376 [Microthyrium microscopicum]
MAGKRWKVVENGILTSREGGQDGVDGLGAVDVDGELEEQACEIRHNGGEELVNDANWRHLGGLGGVFRPDGQYWTVDTRYAGSHRGRWDNADSYGPPGGSGNTEPPPSSYAWRAPIITRISMKVELYVRWDIVFAAAVSSVAEIWACLNNIAVKTLYLHHQNTQR